MVQSLFGERKKISLGFLQLFVNLKCFPNLISQFILQLLIRILISFSFNQALILCINTHVLRFNKSVFNWTFCQLLT